MAEIAEVQIMKPRTFSDGTDTYKGIRECRWQVNPLPSVGVRLEGELRPSRLESIESDTPKVTGSLIFSGPAPDALLDTNITEATFSVRDVTTAAGTRTVTFDNLIIKGSSGGANNRNVGEFTYQFEATDVEDTADA
jgi:hypothetical protein